MKLSSILLYLFLVSLISIIIFQVYSFKLLTFSKNIASVLVLIINCLLVIKIFYLFKITSWPFKPNLNLLIRLSLIILLNLILGIYSDSKIILLGTLLYPAFNIFKAEN